MNVIEALAPRQFPRCCVEWEEYHGNHTESAYPRIGWVIFLNARYDGGLVTPRGEFSGRSQRISERQMRCDGGSISRTACNFQGTPDLLHSLAHAEDPEMASGRKT
jgi:hypothetical protein